MAYGVAQLLLLKLITRKSINIIFNLQKKNFLSQINGKEVKRRVVISITNFDTIY